MRRCGCCLLDRQKNQIERQKNQTFFDGNGEKDRWKDKNKRQELKKIFSKQVARQTKLKLEELI